MIKHTELKTVKRERKGKKQDVILRMALRVCDKCGKEEEVDYGIVRTSRKKRYGEEKDYCYKCAQLGRPMPKGCADKKWKHGKTHNGYVRITVNNNRILAHVHVMQESLGRVMEKGETIHHIDMDKTNNDLSNLYLFDSQSKHQACHVSMEQCGFELIGKRIWFDWVKKEYVLQSASLPENKKVVVKEVGKLSAAASGYSDAKYWIYNEKDEHGVWRKRKYHILISEAILGRKLFQNECVHHVNGDTLDNSLQNLCVLTKVEHGVAHCSLQKAVAEMLKIGVVCFEHGRYFLRNNDNEKN